MEARYEPGASHRDDSSSRRGISGGTEGRSGRRRAAAVAGFLLLWLGVGFVTGTAVLLGPMRWATGALRDAGAGPGAEAWVARGIMAAFVVLSFAVALWLYRLVRGSRSWLVSLAIPSGVALATLGTVAMWLSPSVVSSDVLLPLWPEARFVLGPYPEEDDLRRLRESGYTAVVSLLHPAVVPFEPRLLAREREAARRAGIRMIHVPMLPWVGDNTDALRRLRELARTDGAHYYVHCYLGRDRVRVAARVARDAGAGVRDARSLDAPRRRLAGVGRLERGTVTEVADGLFLGPYPTDEEYLARVLATEVRTVVSVLDPSLPDDTAWIRRERETLRPHPVLYRELPLSHSPDSARVHAVADSVRRLPRPVLIHGFRAPSARTRALEAALRR